MRVIESGRVRSGFLLLMLAILLAGDAWRFTIGWVAFGVIAVALGVASVIGLVATRQQWRFNDLPYPLIVFMGVATLSVVWSFYPAASLLGLATTWLIAIAGVAVAILYDWPALLRGLGLVLRGILALSLVFELFVSLVLRAPLLPFHTQPGVDYSQYDTIPKMLYWSRNELFSVFDEGRIQGIVGNSNTLGFLALLALIVFTIQLVDRRTRRNPTIAWLAVAATTVVFTRSATVTVAIVGVALVALSVLLVRRAATARARVLTYSGIALAVALGATAAVTLRETILAALGKSADLTGRLGIWQSVIDLAQQRPVQGWGWVSFWVPWAAPFDTLAFRNGVRQLQAHNAWIDVWFQLGIIGLIVFAVLVVGAAVRSWAFAVDQPQIAPDARLPFTATTMLPVLVLAALLVQSLSESRLLVEFGFFLLVVIAVRTKRGSPAGVDG